MKKWFATGKKMWTALLQQTAGISYYKVHVIICALHLDPNSVDLHPNCVEIRLWFVVLSGQTLWRTVHLETEINTCIHIAKIDTQAFCFQLHQQILQLQQAVELVRFRPHHFSADRTCTRALWINNTLSFVDIKTSKPGHLRRASHHWTDIIPITTKVSVPAGLCTVYRHLNNFWFIQWA